MLWIAACPVTLYLYTRECRPENAHSGQERDVLRSKRTRLCMLVPVLRAQLQGPCSREGHSLLTSIYTRTPPVDTHGEQDLEALILERARVCTFQCCTLRWSMTHAHANSDLSYIPMHTRMPSGDTHAGKNLTTTLVPERTHSNIHIPLLHALSSHGLYTRECHPGTPIPGKISTHLSSRTLALDRPGSRADH